MRKNYFLIFFVMITSLLCACDQTDEVKFPEYNVVITDDEYNALLHYYMGLTTSELYDGYGDYSYEYPLNQAKWKMKGPLGGGAYAIIGRIDYEDTLEKLPIKKSITEILKRQSKYKWVEAGHDDGYELNIDMNENGLNVLVSDTVNQSTVYEFDISTEQLKEAERYNYLIYEIPGSDESIYFYCRREDYITIRTISGDYLDGKCVEKIYNFVPEGTDIEENLSISLQNIKIFSGNMLFEFQATMKLQEENGVVSGTVTYQKWNKLNSYEMSFSGVVEDGILEFSDYECIHFARYYLRWDYLKQADSVSGLSGKIYFYRTFLLFEDPYTGNEYAFGYDTIKNISKE